MKPILSISEKKFSAIPNGNSSQDDDKDDDKRYIIDFAQVLRVYDVDYMSREPIARNHINTNINYIEELFIVAPYLYQYYELSQKHLDLLDSAAANLINLYKKQILVLAAKPEVAANEKRTEFSEYLNKAALTFQTAADKTEDPLLSKRYRSKAEEYSAKADEISVILQREHHLLKMKRLYQQAAKEPVIGKLLRSRARECQAKYDQEVSSQRESFAVFSPDSATFSLLPALRRFGLTSSDTQPLLRHRHISKPAEDPEPPIHR